MGKIILIGFLGTAFLPYQNFLNVHAAEKYEDLEVVPEVPETFSKPFDDLEGKLLDIAGIDKKLKDPKSLEDVPTNDAGEKPLTGVKKNLVKEHVTDHWEGFVRNLDTIFEKVALKALKQEEQNADSIKAFQRKWQQLKNNKKNLDDGDNAQSQFNAQYNGLKESIEKKIHTLKNECEDFLGKILFLKLQVMTKESFLQNIINTARKMHRDRLKEEKKIPIDKEKQDVEIKKLEEKIKNKQEEKNRIKKEIKEKTEKLEKNKYKVKEFLNENQDLSNENINLSNYIITLNKENDQIHKKLFDLRLNLEAKKLELLNDSGAKTPQERFDSFKNHGKEILKEIKDLQVQIKKLEGEYPGAVREKIRFFKEFYLKEFNETLKKMGLNVRPLGLAEPELKSDSQFTPVPEDEKSMENDGAEEKEFFDQLEQYNPSKKDQSTQLNTPQDKEIQTKDDNSDQGTQNKSTQSSTDSHEDSDETEPSSPSHKKKQRKDDRNGDRNNWERIPYGQYNPYWPPNPNQGQGGVQNQGTLTNTPNNTASTSLAPQMPLIKYDRYEDIIVGLQAFIQDCQTKWLMISGNLKMCGKKLPLALDAIGQGIGKIDKSRQEGNQPILGQFKQDKKIDRDPPAHLKEQYKQLMSQASYWQKLLTSTLELASQQKNKKDRLWCLKQAYDLTSQQLSKLGWPGTTGAALGQKTAPEVDEYYVLKGLIP